MTSQQRYWRLCHRSHMTFARRCLAEARITPEQRHSLVTLALSYRRLAKLALEGFDT